MTELTCPPATSQVTAYLTQAKTEIHKKIKIKKKKKELPVFAPGCSRPRGDLCNPGIKSRSPALQTDSLLSEPTGTTLDGEGPSKEATEI